MSKPQPAWRPGSDEDGAPETSTGAELAENRWPDAAPGQSPDRDAVSSTEEIIEDARDGRMFILVDHRDRENEGDLIIPAEMATPQAINFMATHGRGLICLALPPERVDALGLPLMTSTNTSRHETAFTVSIEAREGVTTGISAHDRARTIAVAIDPASRAKDITTPGHVFPLRARSGGVLIRAGHTEAAVDIANLAGLTPAGVICEIMREDGDMARLPDLLGFARRHGLKIGTISDLIAYRRRHNNLVKETARRNVSSAFGGDWELRIFTDEIEGTEHVALIKGNITTRAPVLVRTHALNALEDVLGLGPAPADELPRAMELIAAEGRGIVLLFRESAKKISSSAGPTPQTLKHTGIGAQILSSLGLSDIVLLSNSPTPTVVGLDAYGLSITGTRPIT